MEVCPECEASPDEAGGSGCETCNGEGYVEIKCEACNVEDEIDE